jgi:transposase
MTSKVCMIGLDLAKNVFQVHGPQVHGPRVYGADASGSAVFRKQLRRGQVLKFLADLPRCLVAMPSLHWST